MSKLTTFFFNNIAIHKHGLSAFCSKNNLNYNTVKSWRRNKNKVVPTIDNFNNVLAPLGYELQIVPKQDLYND